MYFVSWDLIPKNKFDKKDTEKSDTGTYKCISKSPNGPYITMKTELEVIDVSYLPEVDDWQVQNHIENTNQFFFFNIKIVGLGIRKI